MKAYRKKDHFKPVILELESQDEVDVLFAVSNYIPIIVALQQGRIDISKFKDVLRKFVVDYDYFHKLLMKRI